MSHPPIPQSPRKLIRAASILGTKSLWQKWGGHVHPIPPRADVPETLAYD